MVALSYINISYLGMSKKLNKPSSNDESKSEKLTLKINVKSAGQHKLNDSELDIDDMEDVDGLPDELADDLDQDDLDDQYDDEFEEEYTSPRKNSGLAAKKGYDDGEKSIGRLETLTKKKKERKSNLKSHQQNKVDGNGANRMEKRKSTVLEKSESKRQKISTGLFIATCTDWFNILIVLICRNTSIVWCMHLLMLRISRI